MKNAVLIVDDEKINRLILKKIIEGIGIQCYEAEDGKNAIEVLKKNNDIKTVLLDLNMPVLDGYGFLEKFGNKLHEQEMSVHIITGSDRNTFYNTVLEKEINTSAVKSFMNKPIDIKAVLDLVKNEITNIPAIVTGNIK